MLKIKKEFGKYLKSLYDYELENGLLLFCNDWNGESYIKAFNPKTNKWNNNTFKPIARFQKENINLEELEENTKEWKAATEIIGFEEC